LSNSVSAWQKALLAERNIIVGCIVSSTYYKVDKVSLAEVMAKFRNRKLNIKIINIFVDKAQCLIESYVKRGRKTGTGK